MTSIEICSQVLSYQKRYWWMLSSILDQKNLEDNKLVVKCNFHNKDLFDDLSTKILDTFCPLLNLKPKFYDGDRFGVRGYTRMMDIREAECEWMLFTDADVVFPKNFFNGIFAHLKKTNGNGVYTVSRNTMEQRTAYTLIEIEQYVNKPIKNTFDKVKNYANEDDHRHVPGAGYFQLFRRQDAIDKRLDVDESWFNEERNLLQNRRKFSGDLQFRRKMGSVGIIPTTIELMHLNHYRAGERLFDPRRCR